VRPLPPEKAGRRLGKPLCDKQPALLVAFRQSSLIQGSKITYCPWLGAQKVNFS